MNDKAAILALNTAFYAAFANGDLAELLRLWANDDTISCIHPGWPPILGRAAVIGSWRDLLSSPARPKILCREPYAIVAGEWGNVLCIELVANAPLAASNHFRRIEGSWRLVHHQASPISQLASAKSTNPARRIH